MNDALNNWQKRPIRNRMGLAFALLGAGTIVLAAGFELSAGRDKASVVAIIKNAFRDQLATTHVPQNVIADIWAGRQLSDSSFATLTKDGQMVTREAVAIMKSIDDRHKRWVFRNTVALAIGIFVFLLGTWLFLRTNQSIK
jgi:hypothetical protein